MILYFSAFKNFFKVSNAWIVQPQTVERKWHAPLISQNLAIKKSKNNYHYCEHFVTHLFHNFSQVLKFKGKSTSKYANDL